MGVDDKPSLPKFHEFRGRGLGHRQLCRPSDRRGLRLNAVLNAFLAVDDVAALQAAADRLSPDPTRLARGK